MLVTREQKRKLYREKVVETSHTIFFVHEEPTQGPISGQFSKLEMENIS